VTYLQVSAGVGPEECAYAASAVVKAILEAMTAEVVDSESSREGNLLSAILAISDTNEKSYIQSWIGTIQCIWKSKYRPGHKRKNWFVSVTAFDKIEKDYSFKESDIRFETAKSTGHGGQGVNTTDSMVRAIHIPTGKSVVCRSERSQLINKRTALLKLEMLFEQERQMDNSKQDSQLRHRHYELERGNPVRVLKLI
jgi:peptide chain release factor